MIKLISREPVNTAKCSDRKLLILTTLTIFWAGWGIIPNEAQAQSQSTVGCPHCNSIPARKCVYVEANKGWQYFNFSGQYNRITSISGGWSVDARNYRNVGPLGHSEPGLEPYNQYKYDQSVPFGALFVDIPTDGYGYVWARGRQWLPKPITRTAMRINGADNALSDNAGVLQVCFGR